MELMNILFQYSGINECSMNTYHLYLWMVQIRSDVSQIHHSDFKYVQYVG